MAGRASAAEAGRAAGGGGSRGAARCGGRPPRAAAATAAMAAAVAMAVFLASTASALPPVVSIGKQLPRLFNIHSVENPLEKVHLCFKLHSFLVCAPINFVY